MIRIFRTKIRLNSPQLLCALKTDNLEKEQLYFMWVGILASYDIKAPNTLEELNPKQINNTDEFLVSIKKDITEYSLQDQLAIDFFKRRYNMLNDEQKDNVRIQIDSMH